MNQSFPKSVRLRKQSEFDSVYKSDLFAADNTLVVKGTPNYIDVSRLGLSVSRKVGNAVVRNRWKRQIREAFRTQRVELPSGLDLVVRPRKGAVCNHANIARSIKKLVERLARKSEKQAR